MAASLDRMYGEPGDIGVIVEPDRWINEEPGTLVTVHVLWDGDESGWKSWHGQRDFFRDYRAGDRVVVNDDGSIVKFEDDDAERP